MKRVLTALVLIPLVLALVIKAPLWLVALVAALFGLAATSEYLQLVEGYGFRPLRTLSFAAVTALFIGMLAASIGLDQMLRRDANTLPPVQEQWLAAVSTSLTLVALIGGPLLSLAGAMRREDLRTALPVAALSVVPLFYVGVPFLALVGTQYMVGPYFLLFLFVVVWSGDIAAYYFGRRFGRHKLAPRISPNKSWEGAAASLVVATTLGLVFYRYGDLVLAILSNILPFHDAARLCHSPQDHSVWLAAFMAPLGNVAAQIGDLVESAIKRGAGVKDSGNLLPGHGGVLDRIDALLFASPVVWCYALLATLRLPA